MDPYYERKRIQAEIEEARNAIRWNMQRYEACMRENDTIRAEQYKSSAMFYDQELSALNMELRRLTG